jgi:hypothetical protein
MAEQKKLTQAKKQEFHSFSHLPDDPKFTIMSFFSLQTNAGNHTLVSSDVKRISEENLVWNDYLKPQYRVTADAKESAKEIYRKYPERRLPQYCPKIIKLRKRQAQVFVVTS